MSNLHATYNFEAWVHVSCSCGKAVKKDVKVSNVDAPNSNITLAWNTHIWVVCGHVWI